MLQNAFFSYVNLIAGIKPGTFTLFCEELNRFAEMSFKITSVGSVVFTTLSKGGLAVLLVSEEPGRWDTPSGKVEAEDSSPRHTGVRELFEETQINVDPYSLLPLTWAVHPTKRTAAVQYLAFLNYPEDLNNRLENVDDLGRHYFSPDPSAKEQNRLVLEPYGVFSKRWLSLLNNSHHSWAYKLTRQALVEKLKLMREAGDNLDFLSVVAQS